MVRDKGQKDTDGLEPCNGCKGFTKVHAFDLRIALCHQSCFVADDRATFILLVLEDPLGTDNIAAMIGSFHESPNIIPLEVVEFLLHCIQPIGIVESIINFEWFHPRDKVMVRTKVCKLPPSGAISL